MSCENTGVDTQKREEVRAHYANTAKTSCSCGTSVSNIYSPEQIAELPADTVKASRGCADPHAFAQLKEGETVMEGAILVTIA